MSNKLINLLLVTISCWLFFLCTTGNALTNRKKQATVIDISLHQRRLSSTTKFLKRRKGGESITITDKNNNPNLTSNHDQKITGIKNFQFKSAMGASGSSNNAVGSSDGAAGASGASSASGSSSFDGTAAANSDGPGSAKYALKVALAAKDIPKAACQHVSCGACVSDPECGWCEVRGVCQSGDNLGPSPGVGDGCTLWSFGNCIGTDCRNLDKCSECMSNQDCGWCESDCTCSDKHASDPTTPAYGECVKGWFVADGWLEKSCPIRSESTCSTIQKIQSDSVEAAAEKKALEAAELNDIETLSEETYPLKLRVLGKLSLVGIDQKTISNEDAKQRIRTAISIMFHVRVLQVALPVTKSIAPLIPRLKPVLLLEVEQQDQLKGFIGNVFNQIKGGKAMPPPPPPPPPPKPPKPMGEIKFKIGCTNEDEQLKVFEIGQKLSSGDSKPLLDLIVAQGLISVKNAEKAVVTNLLKGQPEDIAFAAMKPKEEKVEPIQPALKKKPPKLFPIKRSSKSSKKRL